MIGPLLWHLFQRQTNCWLWLTLNKYTHRNSLSLSVCLTFFMSRFLRPFRQKKNNNKTKLGTLCRIHSEGAHHSVSKKQTKKQPLNNNVNQMGYFFEVFLPSKVSFLFLKKTKKKNM